MNLFENPLINPPIDIVREGKDAIRRYFERIREEGRNQIFEAKLTLVGEGSAGKTSLQVRLLDEAAELPGGDARTRGIRIYDWYFKGDDTHVAHIWDFGGQDVYYPVHRFFLTENSVFVLLASTRQTTHNFDYWIPTIYQFGGSSPIILGQTCHDGNKIVWNDLGTYFGNPHFNLVKTRELPYHELDLPRPNEGLAAIRKTIIDQIEQLPHYGKDVPASWVSVRQRIAEAAGECACITFDRFRELCRQASPGSFSRLADIEDYAGFLHSIGVILWYSRDEFLRHWVVLQPEWAMNAVYRIIDDERVQQSDRRGLIFQDDFCRLWADPSYEGMHTILRKMLQVFKIAFPKKHRPEDYIIPARLLSMPNEARWPEEENCLRLVYTYEFMPRGLVNQVSAELSRDILIGEVTGHEQVWNNAVEFCSSNSSDYCQVVEDFYNRRISIRAKGRKDARGLIMRVMKALEDITDGYKGVKPEIQVPCTCSYCSTSSEPTTFRYAKLLRWSARNEHARVTCNESGDSIPIEELLYHVGLRNPVKEAQQRAGSRVVRIFLASSSELEEDRREFELFISRENKRLQQQAIFLQLELWEDFIDAMTRTRLQDKYNEAARGADIFVSLFFTRAGQYTAEELAQAYQQFKTTGKPMVYTYFKEAPMDRKGITRDGINSLFDMEERLHALGHFPTRYATADALVRHFRSQLDRILPELVPEERQ